MYFLFVLYYLFLVVSRIWHVPSGWWRDSTLYWFGLLDSVHCKCRLDCHLIHGYFAVLTASDVLAFLLSEIHCLQLCDSCCWFYSNCCVKICCRCAVYQLWMQVGLKLENEQLLLKRIQWRLNEVCLLITVYLCHSSQIMRFIISHALALDSVASWYCEGRHNNEISYEYCNCCLWTSLTTETW